MAPGVSYGLDKHWVANAAVGKINTGMTNGANFASSSLLSETYGVLIYLSRTPTHTHIYQSIPPIFIILSQCIGVEEERVFLTV